jgi:hypothetical protein
MPQRQPHPTGILMTLAEILATFPVGSDERLEALAAWRQAQDQVAVKERDTKRPAAKPRHVEPHVSKRDLTAACYAAFGLD